MASAYPKGSAPGNARGDPRYPGTLTLTHPQPGQNAKFDRILLGMHDYGSGLDLESLEVSADFTVDGIAAGTNLAPKLLPKPEDKGVWELQLDKPVKDLEQGTLTVAVRDRQGNLTSIVRSFRVR